jgi:hypothetical protein
VSRVGSWTTGLSHTPGSGSNRGLLFVVGYENGADPGVSSVSFGGQTLTRINGTVAGTTTVARVELWYLNEAGISAASGSTFSVTWGGAAPSNPMYAAATYQDVSQCAPIGDSSTNSTDAATPNPLTTGVSVTSGAMAVSGAISGNNGSYTWNNGWTEGTDQTSGVTTTMSSAEHPASGSGTDTASATHSNQNRAAIAGAVLNFANNPGVCQNTTWTTGLTHTVTSGSNRALVFAVGYENAADPGVASVTYGGQALTRIDGAVAGTSTFGRVELWYLNEAGIAAAGGNTFSVTWGGSAPSNPMYAAASYTAVDQCNPIATSSINSTDAATPNPLTTNVSVTSGAVAVGAVISGNSGSYTWNNGWTEGSDQTSGATTTMSTAEHAATASGTDTASATHSNQNRAAIVAAVLNPASSASVCQVSTWTTGLTHTVGAGSNRLLIFAVGDEDGTSDPGVSSVTYGGQTLTRIAGDSEGTGSGGIAIDRVELWYLNAAGIAAASGTTFTVTWGGPAPADPMYAAASFANVNQTTPIAASSTNKTPNATPNPLTTSVSASAGSLAVGGVISGNSGSYTWNNAWTEGVDQTSSNTTTMSTASYSVLSTGTQTASATHSGPNRQVIVAAVLNRS